MVDSVFSDLSRSLSLEPILRACFKTTKLNKSLPVHPPVPGGSQLAAGWVPKERSLLRVGSYPAGWAPKALRNISRPLA